MADKIERIIADTFLQMAEGLETGNFGKKPKIALTGMGSERRRRKCNGSCEDGRQRWN